MNSNDRNNLQNLASSMGMKTSSYNANVQVGNGNQVKHIDYNRTLINGNVYYGASNAANALKKLK